MTNQPFEIPKYDFRPKETIPSIQESKNGIALSTEKYSSIIKPFEVDPFDKDFDDHEINQVIEANLLAEEALSNSKLITPVYSSARASEKKSSIERLIKNEFKT